ncbi:Uma2 family endonuclease [Streptomyces sp. NPDC017988]|uniref:Uma2 family endonuclease n=1 Tax=Streptomyces sp. NPDC017988 TaxID=3365025 RepID=UPI0037B0E80C
MTAEPISEPISEPVSQPVSGPRWPVPPPEGWTVDDLHTLPDLPPHTELIDGSLIFVSPQRNIHSIVIDMLVTGLRHTAPPELLVRREMTMVIDRKNGPEPDVQVVRRSALKDIGQSSFPASEVLLAVEVASPESESRDRTTKPHKYAAAGIPHYWLVEMAGQDERPVVQVYERGSVTGTYALTGIHHDRLKITVPFGIDIDLNAIDEL